MQSDTLIVGAGPTGLTAAVELARRGVIPRVIDKKSEASTLSRAVGINPATLKILRESGTDKKLIEAGIKIRKAILHYDEKPAFSLNLGLAPKPYDFLLALPQDVTETILIEEFEALGGRIEFGTEFNSLTHGSSRVGVRMNADEQAEFEFVLGADGLRSAVRTESGIEYEGIELGDKWSIVDFDSESWPHKDEICLFLYDGGTVCLVVPIAKNRYRGVCDRPNAVNTMPASLKIDAMHREGEFVIWVKQAKTYRAGNVFLAGDSAHSHSPVGGRGMNLGMADAALFAELFIEKRLDEYDSLRHPVGRKTIALTERGRKFATSGNSLKPFVMRSVFRNILKIGFVHERVVRTILDC